MHVLEYLRDPACESDPREALTADYRLLCSGTVHREMLGEWYKSELARFVLVKPLTLCAISRPFEEYPLEFLPRITVPLVKENTKSSAGVVFFNHFHPDSDVARDLAALLTLLCRRLITVSGKASEQYANHEYYEFGHLPLPLATSMRRVYWPSRPASVLISHKSQQVLDNNPPHLAVNPCALTTSLLQLPNAKEAESIVASARLYALALELLFDQPEIAYQMLISAVETMANAALKKYQPSEAEKLEHKKSVFDLAMDMELGEWSAKQLALAACNSEFWATKKFKKFLTENIDGSIWDNEDDLFRMPRQLLPKREDFERTLGRIYKARSHATHLGHQFPAAARYAGGGMIPMHIATEFYLSESPFPPVIWFERIVNNAIRNFWQGAIKGFPPVALHPVRAPSERAAGSEKASEPEKG
jgi:hypothetical protein